MDLKSGSVGAGGDGNAKASFTSRTDIARYVAYVLTSLPPTDIKNKTFRIEGERAVSDRTVIVFRDVDTLLVIERDF